ncbi:MAG: hypothetical protein ACFFBD_29000 [Candidatus Hodarchaeota archaeon]
MKRQSYEQGLETILNTFSTVGTRILALMEIDTLFTCLDPRYGPRDSPFRSKGQPMESVGGEWGLTLDWMNGSIRNAYIANDFNLVREQTDQLYRLIKRQKARDVPVVQVFQGINYLLPFTKDKELRDQLLDFCDNKLALLKGERRQFIVLTVAHTFALRVQLHQETDITILRRIKLLLEESTSLYLSDDRIVDLCRTLTLGRLCRSVLPNPKLITFAEGFIATIHDPLRQQQLSYIIARAHQRLQPSLDHSISLQALETVQPTPVHIDLLLEEALYLWELNQKTQVENYVTKFHEWFLTNLSLGEELRQKAQDRVIQAAKEGKIPKLDYRGSYDIFQTHLTLAFHIAIKLTDYCLFSKQTESLSLITKSLEGKLVEKYSNEVLNRVCNAWARLGQPKPILDILQQMFKIITQEVIEIGAQLSKGVPEKHLEVAFSRLYDGMLNVIEAVAVAYYHTAHPKIIAFLGKVQNHELLELFFSSWVTSFPEASSLLFLHMLAKEAFEEATQLSWEGAYGFWETEPFRDLSGIQGGLVGIDSSISTQLKGVRGTKGLKNLKFMTLPIDKKSRQRTTDRKQRPKFDAKSSPVSLKSSKKKRSSTKSGRQTSLRKTRRR